MNGELEKQNGVAGIVRRFCAVSMPLLAVALLLSPPPTLAAPPQSPVTLSNDKPVEVSADTLEVQQDKQQAIFSGNVIATQGNIHMRAGRMVVHYVNQQGATPKNAAAAQGISRIEASGNVIFTNPTDTAKGDLALYDVEKETLDLTGNVVLTREQNILKGSRMHYDLKTSRSTLTSGTKSVNTNGQPVSGGRVHGVFVPNNKPKTGTTP